MAVAAPGHRRFGAWAFGAWIVAGASTVAAGAAPDVQLVDEGGGVATIEVVGLAEAWTSAWAAAPPESAGWARCVSVHVAFETGIADVAVAGRWSFEDARLRFAPAFPLTADLPHRVRLDPACLAGLAEASPTDDWMTPIERTIRLAPASPAPEIVVEVEPSGLVPENLLRVYVSFSAPMRRGGLYRRLRWIDATEAREIPHPFLEIEPELWDGEQRRLTLFLDPGRIKRGLRPHRDAGTPLLAGRSYRLEVLDDTAHDEPQNVLGAADFQVVEADRRVPSVEHWDVQAPDGGRSALVVAFPDRLDAGLLRRALTVMSDAGTPVLGVVEVGDQGRSWRFRPDAPWPVGRYQLVVETILEDLAGNSLRGLFDRDVQAGDTEEAAETVSIGFKVGASSARP